MTQRPPDLEPEERDFYDRFRVLRTEVFELVDGMASLVLERIERRQADEERLRSPEPVEVASGSLLNIIGTLSRLFQDERGDDDDLRQPPRRDDEDES
jgi:hypothetical protein